MNPHKGLKSALIPFFKSLQLLASSLGSKCTGKVENYSAHERVHSKPKKVLNFLSRIVASLSLVTIVPRAWRQMHYAMTEKFSVRYKLDTSHQTTIHNNIFSSISSYLTILTSTILKACRKVNQLYQNYTI